MFLHTDISEMRTLYIMISGSRHKTMRFLYFVGFYMMFDEYEKKM